MYSKKYIETRLLQHFSGKETFSREELFDFLRQFEPDLKESTLAWRIFDLKQKDRIKDVAKGIYSLEHKRPFKPQADDLINKIGSLITNSFLFNSCNIWTTAWLNDLTELQATSFLYLVEVDRGSMEQVFFLLKDKGHFSNVFINPDSKVIEHYISEQPNAIIVIPMISRAPTMKVNGITIPTLEKILVDLYCDPRLYFAFQGQQLDNIFETALSGYEINYSRMLNYAKRRNRDDDLKEFLRKNQNLRKVVSSIIE
jgi:hypothetical protein